MSHPHPCPTCGAHRLAGVCPVCQQFTPQRPRSAVAGAGLLGGIAGLVAVAGWAGLLAGQWDRWQRLFGTTGEPPEVADARAAAVAAGLLLFAVAGVASAAAVAWVGRRP